MSGCVLDVFFLCWSLLVSLDVAKSCFLCCQCGDVSPNDPLVFVNETLELNCSLTSSDSHSNSSSLYFVHGETRVDRSYYDFVDDRTLTFRKVAEFTDAGVYYCHRENFSGPAGLVGGQVLQIDYEPEEVTELTCIWYNWKDRLECNWQLPAYIIKYTEVKLKWYNGAQGQCPHMSKNMTSCTFSSDIALDVSNWYFQFTVTNTGRNVTVTGPWIRKSPLENVKPNKVNNFDYEYTNDSSCVQLIWTYDVSISRHRQKQFRVRYSSSSLEDEETVLTNDDRGILVCYLEPYTMYTFTVDVKAVRSPFYSDPVTISVQTDQDVPLAAPELHKGAYRRSRNSCLLDPDGYHDVTFYWKKIPMKDARGVIVRYTMKFAEVKTGKEVGNDVNITSNYTSVYLPGSWLSCSLRLKCNASYDVMLQPATKTGPSETWSYITVALFSRHGASPPSANVEENDGDYEVTWARSQQVGLIGFTIFYCQRKNKTYCNGELMFVDVDKSYTHTTLVVPDKDSEYLFGVSSDFGQYGSGFELISCVYHKNAVPPPPPDIVITSRDSTYAILTWNHVTCSEYAPIIVSYTIRWSKVNEEFNNNEESYVGKNTSILAHQSAPFFLLDEIHDSGTYRVQIRSSSSVLQGPFSDPVYITLDKTYPEQTCGGKSNRSGDDVLSLYLTLAVAVIILCILCVAVSIICYSRRRVRRQKDVKLKP